MLNEIILLMKASVFTLLLNKLQKVQNENIIKIKMLEVLF